MRNVPMYEVKVIQRFSARHGLRNFQGADEPMHEHRWRLEVVVDADRLDESGCAVDFHAVDRAIATAITPYEKKSFNDVPPFLTTSPSAEAIARHFFGVLSVALNTRHVHVRRVTIGEDEEHCASYCE